MSMPRQLLVDTNLTLLLVVGLTDREYIAKHKRLAAYRVADFEALEAILRASSGMVFCPNVWTETSNLARYIAEPMRTEIAVTLQRVASADRERYVPTKTATERPEYERLGVTDAALLCLAESNARLLTDDLDLYLAALRAGFDAVNYNHLRA